jgi:hypothetical protein
MNFRKDQPNSASGAAFAALKREGFHFLHATEMQAMLTCVGGVEPGGWSAFASSWHNMPVDTYMGDGGRYRSRRFAVFTAQPEHSDVLRAPHAPHYQELQFNLLNGGVERWFEPIPPEVTDTASFRSILLCCRDLFDALTPDSTWHVEVHQIRIEADATFTGQPTPEGAHRDGVDWVLVLLVNRTNVAQGETTVYDLEQRSLGSFTLTAPLDAALVNDKRVLHGVTPVEPLDPTQPAHRDVLVVTFRRVETAEAT